MLYVLRLWDFLFKERFKETEAKIVKRSNTNHRPALRSLGNSYIELEKAFSYIELEKCAVHFFGGFYVFMGIVRKDIYE